MELNREHIDDLIAKYFAGEALPDEAMLLDDWKSMSPENLQYFTDSEKIFGIAYKPKTDSQQLYRNILDQLHQYEAKPAKVVKLKSYFTPLRIAASLVIVSLIGLFAASLLKKNKVLQIQPETLIASVDSTYQQKLVDGTHVFLNKHSKIIVEDGFNGKQRKLKLEGEAFFEVVHDDKKPFVIEAGGVLIKDIGTAFNVKAERKSDSVTVSVSEGIVDVCNGEKTVQLMANQSVVYIRSSRTIMAIRNIPENAAAYRTKIFRFNATTLGEITAMLNSVYGPFMILENEDLAKCRITVEFKNESPETIVAIITETLGLMYENRNGQYIIKGATCIQ